jgi:hypothetical protein
LLDGGSCYVGDEARFGTSTGYPLARALRASFLEPASPEVSIIVLKSTNICGCIIARCAKHSSVMFIGMH